MDNVKPKRISVSFSSKDEDQELLKWLESRKDKIGISDYIKSLIKSDPNYIKNRGAN